MSEAGSSGKDSAVEMSRSRIAQAGKTWHVVLNVPRLATLEDVKTAYRSLALLHHPDKGGDADTFHRIKQAFEEGVKRRRVATGAKSKPKQLPKRQATQNRVRQGAAAGQAKNKEKHKPGKDASDPLSAADIDMERARKKARSKPVSFGATRSKLRHAISKWENTSDMSQKTLPNDVASASAPEVAEFLMAEQAFLVDTREFLESGEKRIPGALELSFATTMTEPETVVADIAKMHESGKKLILISRCLERMGVCGLLGSVLLDVFGFDDARIYRLEGGFSAWKSHVESDPRLLSEEALHRAQDAKRDVDRDLANVKSSLDPWASTISDQLRALVEGNWQTEEKARDLTSELLAHECLTELELEESLQMMLRIGFIKHPDARGHWDKVAIDELDSRFQVKVSHWRAKFARVVSIAAAAAAELESAQENLKKFKVQSSKCSTEHSESDADARQTVSEEEGFEDAVDDEECDSAGIEEDGPQSYDEGIGVDTTGQ